MFSSSTKIILTITCAAFILLLSVSQTLYHERPGIYSLRNAAPDTPARFGIEQNDFSWDTLPASRKLHWQNCYTVHQCARLIVPLNYSEPDGETAVIALTRIPSPLRVKSPWYRGPILFNPGGPGGSGVQLMVQAGQLLALIVGAQFDVVGFDPRGIGHSVPRVSFFDTAVERALWETNDIGVINITANGVASLWARSRLRGILARERQSDVLGHINTDQTARDMLRITQAHGKEKLQYWGFSYGSVLGATFAAMFPDKIERLVIDGVVDAENYYATLWSNNLRDTDKTMQAFFDECVRAGSQGCPFYAPTPEDVSRNLTMLYESVRRKPVPVHKRSSYGIVDYARLRSTVFAALYSPYAAFLPLAQGLADLAAGDGTTLFRLLETPAFQCGCDDSAYRFAPVKDAQTAILCNDGQPIPDSLKDSQKYFNDMVQSSVWAEIWANIRTQCVGWPQLSKPHHRGPLVGNTSFPILLIGNTADPVTSLWAAEKTAKGFPGSVVLTQDPPGHCSVAAPSLCTFKYIRNYFLDGILPAFGTVCPVIGSPFPNFFQTEDQLTLEKSLSVLDRKLLDATRSLSTSFKLPRPL